MWHYLWMPRNDLFCGDSLHPANLSPIVTPEWRSHLSHPTSHKFGSSFEKKGKVNFYFAEFTHAFLL
jgi:hypothetical protein